MEEVRICNYNNNNFNGKYLIIDDVPDFTDVQMTKYIKTNPSIGLTMDDAKKCIEILK